MQKLTWPRIAAWRVQVNLARTLRSMLDDSGLARFSGEVDTNVLCFRPKSPTTNDSMQEMQQYLAKEAEVCLTNPVYRGEMWLKAVILNPYTGVSDLKRLVDAFAEHLLRHRVPTGRGLVAQ